MLHIVDHFKVRIDVNEILAFVRAVHFNQSRAILAIVQGMLSKEEHVQLFNYFSVIVARFIRFDYNCELPFILLQVQE